MGSLRITMAEKRLLLHLRRGGAPDDAVGRDLIARFAATVATDESMKQVLAGNSASVVEIELVYGAVLKALMPRPWMNVGGPMLVPTQWFAEPERFNFLLREARGTWDGVWRADKLNHLVSVAIALAIETRAAHDAAYGPPSIEIVESGGLPSAAGCMPAVLIWALGAGLLDAAWRILGS